MRRVELESMLDLAYLASSTPLGAVIMHFKDKDDNEVYFTIGGTRSETIVFYVKSKDEKKRFINLDASRNEVKYTDLPIIDPKIKVIPIIEVKSQDLFTETP